MTYWTCLGLETNVPWPIKETIIVFEGHQLILKPETDHLAPTIAFEHGSKNLVQEDALIIIRRFMSALAWVEGYGIRETFYAGGSFQVGIGKSPPLNIRTNHFEYLYLPNPADPKKKLALALYREGLTCNSLPYKFLSFTKIINILVKEGGKQKRIINDSLRLIQHSKALKRISSLQTDGCSDIGEYLYESGRCAVSHAYDNDIVDPDSSHDLKRMSQDLPLVKAIAEIIIERNLEIESYSNFLSKHLFELEGFKRKLSNTLIEEIKNNKPRKVQSSEIGLILNLGLKNKDDYYGINRLIIKDAEINNETLFLNLTTSDNSVCLHLKLDFRNERIEYNPYAGAKITDQGTYDSIRCILGFYEYIKDLFSNGCLKIEDSETKELLGYKIAFVPMDIDPQATFDNFEHIIESLKKELKRRETAL